MDHTTTRESVSSLANYCPVLVVSMLDKQEEADKEQEDIVASASLGQGEQAEQVVALSVFCSVPVCFSFFGVKGKG